MDQHEGEQLTGLATALTGDPVTAAELLGEVAALARRGGGTDEDSFRAARALLVQRFLRRPRPAVGALAVAPAVAPGELPPELEAVRVRLDQLPALQRAALLLRHRDQLTLGELVCLTERPAAKVTRALTEAESAVDAEPYQLDQLLDALPRPEPWAVQAAERRSATRRRRARGRVLLAVAAAAALVIAASVLPEALRPSLYARDAGQWVYGFTVAPSGEFTPLGRSLSQTEDVMGLRRAGHLDSACTVTVTTAGRDPAPAGRAVRLDGRPARLVAPTETSSAALWWSIGPRTTGRAECEDQAEDVVLLRLAGLVRYGPEAVRLPFALPRLQAEDEVRLVFDYPDGSGAMVTPHGQLDDSPDTVYVSVPSLFDPPRGAPTGTVAVDGTTGRVYSSADGQSVCWATGRHTACVGAYPLQSPTARQRDRVLNRVLGTARVLHLAADVDDRGTWFDARNALPQ